MELNTTRHKELFYKKLINYCENYNVFSIKPLVKSLQINTRVLNQLIKKDTYTGMGIENCQSLCVRNVIIAWKEKVLNANDTIKYLRENSEVFCSFEKYCLTSQINFTKSNLIEQFISNHMLFLRLLRVCEQEKVYTVKRALMLLDYDYEAALYKAASSDEWWSSFDIAHEICSDNIDHDTPLEYGADVSKEIERAGEESIKEYLQWDELKKNREKITPPLTVEITMTLSNNSNALTTKETQELADKKRIESWKNKRATEQPCFSFESKSEGNASNITIKLDNPDMPNIEEMMLATLCAATGSSSEKYGRSILQQLFTSLHKTEGCGTSFAINASHEALLAMNPQDIYEGQLCSRLIMLHDQYMFFMGRAATPNRPIEFVDADINKATKLMRIYNETLEALNRHRKKGEQKIIVQHVNIAEGGKAVVTGSFTQEQG